MNKFWGSQESMADYSQNTVLYGLPLWLSSKESATMQEMQETQVWSLCWEDLLEEAWQPTPVFLPGESHGQRSLMGYSP